MKLYLPFVLLSVFSSQAYARCYELDPNCSETRRGFNGGYETVQGGRVTSQTNQNLNGSWLTKDTRGDITHSPTGPDNDFRYRSPTYTQQDNRLK